MRAQEEEELGKRRREKERAEILLDRAQKLISITTIKQKSSSSSIQSADIS